MVTVTVDLNVMYASEAVYFFSYSWLVYICISEATHHPATPLPHYYFCNFFH